MNGSVTSFGGPVESEDFLLHSTEVIFYAFLGWLELQENGASLLADMSLVNDALDEEYEADRGMVCAAISRLAVVSLGSPFPEMHWLFASLGHAWGVETSPFERV